MTSNVANVKKLFVRVVEKGGSALRGVFLRGETMLDDIPNIEEAFGNLKVPHSHTSTHDLTEMLAIALRAILSGTDGWIGKHVIPAPRTAAWS
jgi:hypothetical protein